jgi:hypothetical protein
LDGGSSLRKAANCTQTSIPQVVFEPMIPVFEREKTVHVLDRAATVIGLNEVCVTEYKQNRRDYKLGSAKCNIDLTGFLNNHVSPRPKWDTLAWL